MSESYAPGTYVKGDVQRVAHTARDAVALVFQGYSPIEQPESKADARSDLEKQADESGAAVVTPGYTGLDDDGNIIDDEPSDAPTPRTTIRSKK